ncbi:hypothetical protein NBRC116188_16670 [Oceaniserpentilla sp. 4NH20-0058]|uniref:hypothetical protein n=1 Tax=Oceaniserpentilla sp. 4NH20-0058 TaxID=3127660 RepID=UPI00310AD500
MKFNTQLKALAAATAIGLSGHAMAEGTAAGTVIDNTVTLGYTVNTVAQTDLTQTADFTVDTKVNFTLTMDETATIKVTPEGTNYVAGYTLTSTSNDTLGFALTLADLATGNQTIDYGTVADTVDLGAAVAVYAEDGTTAGYQSAEDTATLVTNLAADDAIALYVVIATAPDATSLSDGDIAAVSLTADAKEADGSTNLTDNAADAFIEDTQQVVIITSSLTENTAFEVESAKFTDPDDVTDTNKFTLTVNVINDPICDTDLDADTTKVDYSSGTPDCPDAAATYIPKAIPGAMVEYTIKAKNSGSQDADLVNFSVDLATVTDDDPDVTFALVQTTLRNESATFSDGTVTPDLSATTNNVLDVDVSSFKTGEDIEITFTAIVE